MKKTFLLLTMMLLFFIGSGAFNDIKAQTQVTRRFIDPYNCISISQQYYTNAQVGHDGSGNITSMTFSVVNIKENDKTEVDLSEGIERTIEVWIQNADANSSFDENKMVKYNESDKYFSGNIQLLKGQVDVTLNKPFAYDGNDILVCVNDITKTATDYAVYFTAISEQQSLYASVYEAGGVSYVYNPTYDDIDQDSDIKTEINTTDIAAYIQFTFESEGEGGETPEPETPELDLTKYYRIKSVSQNKYLHIKGYNGEHATGSHGDVGLSEFVENDEDQIFKIESTRASLYNFVSANGYSIICSSNGYNVDAYNNVTASSIGIEFIDETRFYLLNGTKYFKVGLDSNGAGYYPYCDAEFALAETWVAEEATLDEEQEPEPEPEPIILSASKTNLEADGTDAVIFTVMQGANNITSDCEIWYGTEKLNGSTFSTKTVGSYKFYAMYGNLLSNEITINAEHSIYISVDKETIVADDTDYVTFTLTQGTEDITDDTDVTFFVDGTAIDGNTYSTTKAASYQAYAMKGEMLSNIISFTATKPATPGNGETVFTPYGSVTYNKGMENEYTLLVDMTTYGGDAAVIMEDNVNFSWGDATNCGYVQDNTNKPNAETSLTIPAYVLNGTTKWIPVTEIADYAFDSWTQSLTDLPENEIEPGNERNDLFTSLVIPNTVTNIGQFAFSCELEGPIFCYASTPPTCEVPNNIYYPFLTNTYNNAILYVPAGSIDAYKTAAGWSRFKTIAPLTISTFENKVDDDWANADNWKKYIEEEDGTYTETWGSLPNAGEDVLINGDAVIPAGYTANVGAINIVSGGITVKDGAQLVHTNAGVAVTVEKEIEGYATREVASTAWHTISSPIAVMTPTNNVNGLLNGAYDLYYYDEPTHYWINHEQETNEFKTLDAGRGYLYANENDVTLKFNGVINYDNVSFKLDATSEYEGLRGFNLIGNPFTHNIHLGANIYSENLNIEGYYSLSKEGQWGVKKASDEAIAPCQGVLVYTNAEETINIVKVAAAPATRSAQPALNITVANEQYDDNAYVLFKEGQGLNKINHMNENIPMVYVISDNEKFAIANVNDNEEIALGFEAMTMGEYTIAVKAQDCKFNNMILTDNITGEKTNLMTDSYTFMATTNDEPNRFTITLNADNDVDNDNDFIYINNNEMIINNIEGNGLVQIYDMMGRSVATYNVSGSANISMDTLSNGVYVVRMTDANGVKTQKVVNN